MISLLEDFETETVLRRSSRAILGSTRIRVRATVSYSRVAIQLQSANSLRKQPFLLALKTIFHEC